jgi:hypothetical protein
MVARSSLCFPVRVLVAFSWGIGDLGKSQFTAMIDDLIGWWAWRTSELGASSKPLGALVNGDGVKRMIFFT